MKRGIGDPGNEGLALRGEWGRVAELLGLDLLWNITYSLRCCSFLGLSQ